VSLIISTRRDGEIAIVHVQGALTLGPALGALKLRIERTILEKPSTGLVLNLSGVVGLDSAGLGELLAIYGAAARHGVRIALVKATPRLKDMLAVTHIDAFFSFHEDERSAVAAL
jgi:anti-anti-sigma factor